MKIQNSYPPNYPQILQYLSPPEDACFAYGETLYVPSGKEVPEDVMVHEEVHKGQMQGWLSEAWWTKYLLDKDFRLAMEREAYATQYRWVKDRVSSKTARLCLFDLASNMSKLYNLGITQSQAETLIRKYAN